MKSFNNTMALMVFALSVICLATTQQRITSYTLLDYALAWMGVICFSTYFLREVLGKFGKKYIGFAMRFRKCTRG